MTSPPMGIADGLVALPSSIAGVGLGALLAAPVRLPIALVIGAVGSALGNWIRMAVGAAAEPHVSTLPLRSTSSHTGWRGGVRGLAADASEPANPGAQYTFL